MLRSRFAAALLRLASASATTAATAAAASGGLLFGAGFRRHRIQHFVGSNALRLLLSRRTLLLVATLLLRLLSFAGPLTARLLLVATALAASWTFRPLAAVAFALSAATRLRGPLPAGALLPLLHLALHELARLRVLLLAGFVEAAVRATFPPFGIRLAAGGAGNTFRQGHRRIGAHCTLCAVPGSDEQSRLETLRTLIALADDSSPNACWDDRRAMNLLRSQSNPDELRSLGASESLIQHIFEARDAR